jgi:hypothetical protein
LRMQRGNKVIYFACRPYRTRNWIDCEIGVA